MRGRSPGRLGRTGGDGEGRGGGGLPAAGGAWNRSTIVLSCSAYCTVVCPEGPPVPAHRLRGARWAFLINKLGPDMLHAPCRPSLSYQISYGTLDVLIYIGRTHLQISLMSYTRVWQGRPGEQTARSCYVPRVRQQSRAVLVQLVVVALASCKD